MILYSVQSINHTFSIFSVSKFVDISATVMEAAHEAGADRAFGVKNLDAETTLPMSTEPSSVAKPSKLSDYISHGHVSNVLVDLPRVNKGGAVRGKQTINM